MIDSWGGEGRAPLPATPLPGPCNDLGWRWQRLVRGLILGVALLGPLPTLAIDAQSSMKVGSIKDTDDYLADLVGEAPPDRRYAGKVLAAQLRRAQDRVMHGQPDALSTLDARATVDTLAREIPSRCRQALRYDNVAVACADMLVRLDVRESASGIRAAATRAPRRRARAKLEAAARALEGVASEAPAASAEPGVQGVSPPPGGALRGSAPPQETRDEATEGSAP